MIDVVKYLRKIVAQLEKEASVAGFLGFIIEINKYGSMDMTQTGLIDRILFDIDL